MYDIETSITMDLHPFWSAARFQSRSSIISAFRYDICNSLTCNHLMFADDLKIFSTENS